MTALWSEHKLGDLIQINPDTLNKTYPYSEIEYLDITSVRTGFYTEVRRLKLEEAPSRAKRLVSDGDTIISTVRPGNKSYCFLKKTTPKMVVSTGFAVLRAKKDLLDERFLYYLVSNPSFTEYLVAHEKGAAYPAVGIETLENAVVSIPDLSTQKKISDVLGSLDDKIELNRRMNETLEQMAMALYKHWFVDFGPFQDGEFVECEIGMIPKGWEIGKLGDVYFTSSGGTPKRDVKSYYEGGTINWLKTKELDDGFIFSTEEKITDSGLQNSSAKIFPENTVVMAMYGATVGKLGILGCPSSTNQACCAIIPQKDEFGYEYIFLYLLYNRSNIIKLANGGAQQNISQQIIKELKILLPPSHVMKEINSNFKWLFSLIRENQRESMYLKETRDYLLPRLLSGEIGLREAEEQVEEVLANA